MMALEARAAAAPIPARRSDSLAAVLRAHWPEYLIEGALLGIFMVAACGFATLLEHPASPARRALGDGFLRRGLMGLAMGATAVRKVAPADALFYAVAQCAGAVLGVALASLALSDAVRHPSVRFAATLPGERGAGVAFLSEIVITFLLMTVVLTVSNAPRWNRFTGLAAGICVALFITFEAPLSGMSMNPARSLGSAVAAMTWASLWIYFVAPPIGMLLAAEMRLRGRGLHSILCAKLHHENHARCIFRCGYPRCGPAAERSRT